MTITGLPVTLARAAALLEAAAGQEGLRFQKACALAGAAPSTVTRLLRSLCAAGLLTHETSGHYRPAPTLHRIAAAVGGAPDLASAAAATVARLAAATGESAAVFVPVEEGIQLLAKHEPDERFRYMPLGGINTHVHAHGVCVLRAAWWDARTARARWQAVGPGRHAGPWLQRLRKLRVQGWIATDDDDQPGISRIAAAAVDAEGALVALVAITGTAAALHARRDYLLQEVRRAAAALAHPPVRSHR